MAPSGYHQKTTNKSQPSTPTVVVMGCGFSGLAAARALRSAAFKVIVLESRDRIGGRVHTDYSFGFPVDMGASWLHGVSQANPLANIISRLQLPLYRTCGEESVLYDHDLESYALYEKDGQQISPELVARVGELFEEILEQSKIFSERLNEDISMQAAMEMALQMRPELRLQGLEQKVLQWYLCRMEGWFATDMDKLSAKHWDEEDHLEGGHGVMVKGYWPVLAALSQGLDIRLNHRVNSVKRGGHSIQITTDNGNSFLADAVVITVPLAVLKAGKIHFEPSLPEWKVSAINDIGVGNENKIVLRFESAFWANVEFLGVVADSSYECSYFLNLHKATGNPVLIFMPAGRLANDLEKLSDEKSVQFALSQLRRILPNAPEPLQYLVSRWGTDPNSLGCYTFDLVGKSADVYNRLRAPVDSLFFAGEATSRDFPGTVHGAYQTGIKAAEECRKLLTSSNRYADLEVFAPAAGEEISETTVFLQISRM